MEEAARVLKTLPESEYTEDGTCIVRSAHYSSYSTGSAIVICEEIYEPEPEIEPDPEIVEAITAKTKTPIPIVCSEEKLDLNYTAQTVKRFSPLLFAIVPCVFQNF